VRARDGRASRRLHRRSRRSDAFGRPPLQAQYPPSDEQRDAVDEAGLVGSHESDRGGDLLGPSDPAERIAVGLDGRVALRVARVGDRLRQHRRVDDARRDADDADVVGTVVARKGAAHHDDAGLGRGIGSRAGLAVMARIAGDVDDDAATLRHHVAQGGPGR